jgi:hypothetical protein
MAVADDGAVVVEQERRVGEKRWLLGKRESEGKLEGKCGKVRRVIIWEIGERKLEEKRCNVEVEDCAFWMISYLWRRKFNTNFITPKIL